MEFVAVLHQDFLQPLQGMVMVAYLELVVLVVLYQDVQVDLQSQDETDYGGEELLQEAH